MNKASRGKDESKIKFYGALASALSFIIHCGNQKSTELEDSFHVYRGLQIPADEMEEKYFIGNKITLKGYTSTTLDRPVAVGFACDGVRGD
jgi:hypothetical protein